MEVNSNLHNSSCSTRNRGRPCNYLFVHYVSSVSFKHILVVVGRRLKGNCKWGFQRSFRERKSESIQGRAAQNRTRKEGKETGRKGVDGKNAAAFSTNQSASIPPPRRVSRGWSYWSCCRCDSV